MSRMCWFCNVNTQRPTQNGRHFPDDIFKWFFLNENVWIPIKISLKFVPNGPINNIPALVQIMAWRRSGDKPLPEPMVVSLLTHICVIRPQWVKKAWNRSVSQSWIPIIEVGIKYQYSYLIIKYIKPLCTSKTILCTSQRHLMDRRVCFNDQMFVQSIVQPKTIEYFECS